MCDLRHSPAWTNKASSLKPMEALSNPVYTYRWAHICTLTTTFILGKLKDYDADEIAAKLIAAGLAIPE